MLYARWAPLLVFFCIIGNLIGQPAKAEDVSVSIGVGDNILVVQGRTSPSAFITITRDGNIIGTINADGSGLFSQTFPAQEPGLHQISADAQTASGLRTDTVSVNVNIAEHATTTVDLFLPPSLIIDQADLAYNKPLQIHGETCPTCTITVYIDNTNYAITTASAEGNWNTEISTMGLSSGGHTFFVRSSDSFGAQSYPTRLRSFVVGQPLTNFVPPATGGRGLSTPVITFPPADTTWTRPSITIRGTADPRVQIELFDNQTNLGSAWSNDSGEWELPIFLESKDYNLRARACRAGICSLLSEPLHFISRITAPLRLELAKSAFNIRQNQPLNMKATIHGGQPPFRITAGWGDGSIIHSTQDNAQIDLSHIYDRAGNYTGWLEVEDANGQRSVIYFTVKVGADSLILLMLIILIMLMLAFFMQYRLIVSRRKNQDRKPVA